MAESKGSPLRFEGGGLDINENMPNTQNCSFSNEELLVDTASSICRESDSAFMETSNSSETSANCIKASEICSEVSLNNFGVTHINTEEFACNQKADSGIHDSENNVLESIKLIEFDGVEENLSENYGVVTDFSEKNDDDTEFKDEEFQDAVQFFKDPSSLVFLEKAGSSNVTSESSIARSSLYQKFDPLHAKFFAQSNVPNQLQEITEDEIEPEHNNQESAFLSGNVQNEVEIGELQNTTGILIEVPSEGLETNIPHDIHENDSLPNVVNKHIPQASPRPSLGSTLISFDSPLINKDMESRTVNEPKMYTEEEFQQALKIQELTIQESVLKKQQESQECFLKRQQELEAKVDQQQRLSSSLHLALKEVVQLLYEFSDKYELLKGKLEVVEKENDKLKEDLKTSVEDIQSVETTFSDFHKRYEQCKNMLKVYTENEKSLKQQLENTNLQLHEKEEMYKALQSRTQEMLDKANVEVANAKKAGEAQVAVLKAQLKKAELKISSLESDVKHVKIENGKLSSICDELMAKVSET